MLPGDKKHVNEHVQERGRRQRGFAPINGPFVQDTNDQIAKDGEQEGNLRYEVRIDVDRSFELEMIWQLQA